MLGEHEKAEAIYQKIVHLYQETAGENHPNLIDACYYLAEIYEEQGRKREAKRFYQKALQTAREVLGEEHEKTRILAGILGEA